MADTPREEMQGRDLDLSPGRQAVPEYVRNLAGDLLNRVMDRWMRTREDPCSAERVHDLRVSIRRFRTCVQEFPDFFPEKRTKKISRQLKRTFKLAGQVRDYDIALQQALDLGVHRNTKVVRTLKELRKASTEALQRELKEIPEADLAVRLKLAG